MAEPTPLLLYPSLSPPLSLSIAQVLADAVCASLRYDSSRERELLWLALTSFYPHSGVEATRKFLDDHGFLGPPRLHVTHVGLYVLSCTGTHVTINSAVARCREDASPLLTIVRDHLCRFYPWHAWRFSAHESFPLTRRLLRPDCRGKLTLERTTTTTTEDDDAATTHVAVLSDEDTTRVPIHCLLTDVREVAQYVPLARARAQDDLQTVYWHRFPCGTLATLRNPTVPVPPAVVPVLALVSCKGQVAWPVEEDEEDEEDEGDDDDENEGKEEHDVRDFYEERLSTRVRLQTFLAAETTPGSIRSECVSQHVCRFGVTDDLCVAMVETPSTSRLHTQHERVLHAMGSLLLFPTGETTTLRVLAECMRDVDGTPSQRAWLRWSVRSKLTRSVFAYASPDKLRAVLPTMPSWLQLAAAVCLQLVEDGAWTPEHTVRVATLLECVDAVPQSPHSLRVLAPLRKTYERRCARAAARAAGMERAEERREKKTKTHKKKTKTPVEQGRDVEGLENTRHERCEESQERCEESQESQESQEAQRPSSECVVCLDGASTHACLPCGHLCACEGCSVSLARECPLCRTPCVQWVRIHVV